MRIPRALLLAYDVILNFSYSDRNVVVSLFDLQFHNDIDVEHHFIYLFASACCLW